MTLDEITQAAKIAGILKDENVEPMPQTFDPALRKFVPSLSDQGSKRVVLYGPDGQPISTVEGKLAVRAEEIETAIANLQTALAGADVDAKTLADVVTALDGKSTEAKQDAANTLLTALKEKDYATQTTLAQVLAKMIAAPATEAKQDALAEKIDGILDGTTPATTALKGSLVQNAFEIIPSDAADLTHETIAIYVGFDGDLKIDLVNGETITMYNLAAGAWHPIAAKKVYATGTTATYILGAYLI